MFHLSSEPLLLSQAGIQGLCPSLNTPVLNIDELPVGSASAAIVLFDDGYGTLSLGVGIRSLETRQVAVFVYRGVVDESKTPAEAMNAALAFAEGMGFLFDEDVVSSDGVGGKGRALAIWTDLTSSPHDLAPDETAVEVPVRSTQALSSPPPEAHELVLEELVDDDGGSEILLDELSGEIHEKDAEPALELDDLDSEEIIEFELPAPPARKAAPKAARRPPAEDSPPGSAAAPRSRPEAVPAPQPEAAAPPEEQPGPRRVALSRFRRPAAQAEPAPAAATPVAQAGPGGAERRVAADDGGASQLGKISLVRRRRSGDAVDERPGLLLRILSSF